MSDYERMMTALSELAEVRSDLDSIGEALRDGQDTQALKHLHGAAVKLGQIAERVQHGQACHCCSQNYGRCL